MLSIAPGLARLRPLHVLLLIVLLAVSLPLAQPPPGLSWGSPESVGSISRPETPDLATKQALGRRPLSFETNRGQFGQRVDFAIRRSGHAFFLMRTGELISVFEPQVSGSRERGRMLDRPARIRMELIGAESRPAVRAAGAFSGATNYLIGDDPRQWQRNIRSYRRVTYDSIYGGIDLIYHGHRSMLEYDFRVSPGADPAEIALRFAGARDIHVGREGDLVLRTSAGRIRHRRPVAFQRIDGHTKPVQARYSLDRRGTVTFALGAYDPSEPLVIDPVVDFATYLGGIGEDSARAVDTDGSGNIYVAGVTTSVDFPLEGAADQDNKGDKDVFITKLSPDGSRIIYSTYLGGSGDESGRVPATNTVLSNDRKVWLVRVSPVDLVVGGDGSVYIAGVTSSDDFPSVNAPPGTSRGSGADAFVTKLDSSGASVTASTLLGGKGEDLAYALDVDPSGNAYVAGRTESSDFPTKGAGDLSCGTDGGCNPKTDPLHGSGVAGDAFIARLDLDQRELDYSGYIGAETDETAYDVVVDDTATAYVAGATVPFAFPCSTSNLPEDRCSLSRPSSVPDKGSVWKVAASGAGVSFATVAGAKALRSIAQDDKGKTYVGGDAQSGTGAQSYFGILGASGAVESSQNGPGLTVTDIAVDDVGRVYMTGVAGGPSSTKRWGIIFPRTNQVQEQGGRFDAFLRVLDDERNTLLSTLIGGSDFENATVVRASFSSILELFGAVAVDGSGGVTMVGQSWSIDFPWNDPLQADLSGGGDAFVSRITLGGEVGPAVAAVAPRSGPTSGGTEVVVEGMGLSGAREVHFGSVPASSYSVIDDGALRVVAPPHAPGAVPITVTTEAGRSQGTYSGARFFYGEGGWHRTDQAATPRYGHTATLLTGPACEGGSIPDYCGKILVTGGETPRSPPEAERFFNFAPLASAELYDPRTGEWSSSICPQEATGANCPAPMSVGRVGHTATSLPNGHVLVVGGDIRRHRVDDPTGGSRPITNEAVASTAEIYNPALGSWTSADEIPLPRFFHTATLLPQAPITSCGRSCGHVLIAAGMNDFRPYGDAWDTAAFYDGQGKITPAASLGQGRFFHDALLLNGPRESCGINCDRVLVVGGYDGTGFHTHSSAQYRTPEIYDPSAQVWRQTTNWARPRILNSTTLLANGEVLTAGGNLDKVNGDGATFPMHVGVSEVYNSATETWRPAGSMRVARYGHVAVRLPNDDVLAAGGMAAEPLALGEIYDAESARWISAGSMETARGGPGMMEAGYGPSATLLSSDDRKFEADPDICGLNCGKVLVVGGSGETFAELYTPEPTIDSLTPTNSATSGTTVTVIGTGFTHDVREVRFGNSSVACPSAACTIDSYSQLTVTAPPQEVGVVDVSVVNEGGESEVGDATKFTYLISPGEVKDLKAEALSGREMQLTFSAPAALGSIQSPQQAAQHYVIKQSRAPITDEASFEAASALCGGTCTFEPPIAKVGDQVSLTVKELSPNTTYHYALKVIEGSTVGSLSNLASATTKATTPGAVADLEAVALSRTSMRLSFSAVGFDGTQPPPLGDYVIKQAASAITDERAFDAARPLCDDACRFAPAAVGDRLTLSVTDLAPATTYHYALRARELSGSLGPISNPASATTLAGAFPSGRIKDLAAKALSKSKIKLSFSPPALEGGDGRPATKYVVKQSTRAFRNDAVIDRARSLCGGVCTISAATPGKKVSLTVTDLKAGRRYHYVVQPLDSAGNPGPPSNPARARTLGGGRRVTDLKAKATSPHKIRLTFSALGLNGAHPAASYVIKRSRHRLNSAKRFRKAKALCGGVCRLSPERAGDRLKLIAKGLRPGSTYYFAVRVKAARGKLGAISNHAKATTPRE